MSHARLDPPTRIGSLSLGGPNCTLLVAAPGRRRAQERLVDRGDVEADLVPDAEERWKL
jgi:hypothetical protein